MRGEREAVWGTMKVLLSAFKVRWTFLKERAASWNNQFQPQTLCGRTIKEGSTPMVTVGGTNCVAVVARS